MNWVATRSRQADDRATQKHLARRARVIDAAAEVFAQKGFHGASTKDIADKVGIRQGSLYYYFDSKERALQEVCEYGTNVFLEGARAIAAGDDAVDVKLAKLIRNHIEPLDKRRPYVIVFVNEYRSLSRERKRTHNKMMQDYEELIEGILKEGVAAGSLPDDLNCRLATLLVIGLCNSVVPWHGREKDAPTERIIQAVTDMVTGGVHKA